MLAEKLDRYPSHSGAGKAAASQPFVNITLDLGTATRYPRLERGECTENLPKRFSDLLSIGYGRQNLAIAVETGRKSQGCPQVLQRRQHKEGKWISGDWRPVNRVACIDLDHKHVVQLARETMKSSYKQGKHDLGECVGWSAYQPGFTC